MASKAAVARGASLYRSILRAHKHHLPVEMKRLGDMYVRSEFKAHMLDAKPQHLQAFFREWDKYLDQITVAARARDSLGSTPPSSSVTMDTAAARNNMLQQQEIFSFGSDLPPTVELSEEQTKQLEKLKEEAEKFGKS